MPAIISRGILKEEVGTYPGGILNKLLDADIVIGDAVVYAGADCIGVPVVWSAGSWKNGGGIGAVLGAIGWEPMPATADVTALLAMAADDSDWE